MARFRRLRRGFTAGSARIALLVIAIVIGFLLRKNPFSTSSALDLEGSASLAASVAASTVVATLFVLYTRFVRRSSAFGRRLAADLDARASGMQPLSIVLVAASASLGEEILFRGVLVPWCGVVVSSIAFGALHVRSGWAWALSASVFGASLALVFVSSGSLAGPLLAHFVVDVVALFTASQARVGDRPVRMSGLLGAVRGSKRGS